MKIILQHTPPVNNRPTENVTINLNEQFKKCISNLNTNPETIEVTLLTNDINRRVINKWKMFKFSKFKNIKRIFIYTHL